MRKYCLLSSTEVYLQSGHGWFQSIRKQYRLYDIPDECRTGADDEARLYGFTYFNLELEVTKVLHKLIDEVKTNPDAKCEYFDY